MSACDNGVKFICMYHADTIARYFFCCLDVFDVDYVFLSRIRASTKRRHHEQITLQQFEQIDGLFNHCRPSPRAGGILAPAGVCGLYP